MTIKSSTALFVIILSSVTFQTIGNTDFANEYLVMMLIIYYVAYKLNFDVATLTTIMFFVASVIYSYIIHSNLTIGILIDFTTILKPYLIGVLSAGLITTLRTKHKTILRNVFVTYMIYNWIIFGLGLSEWHYSKNWEMASALDRGMAGTLNWEMAGATAILFLFSILFLEEKHRGMYILLLCLLSVGFIASGQGKHIGFFIVAFAVVLYFKKIHGFIQSKNISTKLFFNLLAAVFVVTIIFSVIEMANDDINTYYGSSSDRGLTARKAFLINIPKVLADGYIWFGRGLASYGSQASGSYYSSLYYSIGFNKVYGLYKGDAFFVNDAYYAMFIGQLGILGLLFQLLYWRYMLSPFWNCFRSKSKMPTNYIILSTLAVAWSFIFIVGSGLFNSQGCFVMCALGIVRVDTKKFLGGTSEKKQ